MKDSVASMESKSGYTYVLPGSGGFPMASLRGALTTGFSGTVSLEWEKLWIPDLAPLDDALAAARKENWW